ncbi:hypothetical protein FLONG3_1888 [Fusarium longipes]|uniref:Uncharacterized protein n=1 Tax=Fusarium longipes TaxID=694270 RepID=A0A395T5C5_9HYPO|nr:hypothetical protein FLONG3_1888 [Fusarium longipes]
MVGVGKPRLDKHGKILSRLFENLALFHILKRTYGPHEVTTHAPATLADVRRRFLKNLSYVCDYRKGGDTTTSMALEDKRKSVVFWVAGNLTPRDKVVQFLTEILELLRNEPQQTEAEQKTLEDRLGRRCAEFAAPRLKKECKLLHRAARYCENHLKLDADTSQQTEAKELSQWLSQFAYSTETDILTLCQTAYDARHDPQMTTLRTLSQQLNVAPPETTKTFQAVRHFIGRLAERVRTSKHLVQDHLSLRSLLDSYEIKRVDAPTSAKVPPADGLRNLNSILKRMLPANDPRLEGMQSYISRLNGPMNLEEAIRNMYEEDTGQLCVHSEIQVLEEFHRNRRNFVGNDRYIACTPESHQKTYLNWRPVELPGGWKNEHWLDQRRVLAMISSDLAKAVEMQIINQQQPNPRQPDSMTNITASMAEFNLSESQETGGEDEWSEDSASLAHLNEEELSDEYVSERDEHSEESESSDEESDGGVELEI